MKAVELRKNIVLVESFLSLEDLQEWQKVLKTDVTWLDASYNFEGRFKSSNASFELRQSLSRRVAEFASDQYGFDLSVFGQYKDEINLGNYHLWTKGSSLPLHADSEQTDGFPQLEGALSDQVVPSFSIMYSSIVYFSNDYAGGTLEFPSQRLSIRPSAGSAMFFPSSARYNHLVTEVESGERYTASLFLARKSQVLAYTEIVNELKKYRQSGP